jgi:hypothetical protein
MFRMMSFLVFYTIYNSFHNSGNESESSKTLEKQIFMIMCYWRNMIDCCLHKSESLTGRLEYNFKFVLEILSVEKNVSNTTNCN